MTDVARPRLRELNLEDEIRELAESRGGPLTVAAAALGSELVSPREPLVAAFVATLADAPQTQRT